MYVHFTQKLSSISSLIDFPNLEGGGGDGGATNRSKFVRWCLIYQDQSITLENARTQTNTMKETRSHVTKISGTI